MKKILSALAAIMSLSACTAKLPESTVKGIYITDGNGDALVQEIKLSDNTRCAVLVGSYKGSITCDWKSK